LPKYSGALSQGHLPITHSISFSKHAISQYRKMVELFGLKPPSKEFSIENTLLKLTGVYSDGKVNTKGTYIASVMMREFYNGMDYVRETMRAQLTHDDGLIKE
jgi:hypothetical protein